MKPVYCRNLSQVDLEFVLDWHIPEVFRVEHIKRNQSQIHKHTFSYIAYL